MYPRRRREDVYIYVYIYESHKLSDVFLDFEAEVCYRRLLTGRPALFDAGLFFLLLRAAVLYIYCVLSLCAVASGFFFLLLSLWRGIGWLVVVLNVASSCISRWK